jgi:hypothetical protein
MYRGSGVMVGGNDEELSWLPIDARNRTTMIPAKIATQRTLPELLAGTRLGLSFGRGVAYSNVLREPTIWICARNGVATIGRATGAAYCGARSRTPHRGQNAACGNTCFRHRGHGE